MSDLPVRNDISNREMTRGRRLKTAAIAAPIVLAGIPAALFTILFLLFGTAPPAAISVAFLGILFTVIGFIFGLGLSGFFLYRQRQWSNELRERIAARGIRPEELDWFRRELRPSERQTLRLVEARDPLLADAYRETLASRLTASRIVRSSKRELLLMQRRQNKLKYYKTDTAKRFLGELDNDIGKIRSINAEAKEMLAEAEARLQMIDVASVRGSSMADSEVALKKLSARAAELPLALESAKMADEIREELDKVTEEQLKER